MEKQKLIELIAQDFLSKFEKLPEDFDFIVMDKLFDSIDKITPKDYDEELIESLDLEVVEYLEKNHGMNCYF